MPAAVNGVRLAGPMRVAAVTLLLLFAVLPAGVAAAASHDSDDRLVVKGPVRIAKGETAGDVVVLDGPVTVAGRVRGDLVVVSGGLTIRGRVDGDVFTVADRAGVGRRARVGGDLGYANKRPVVPPRARVGGEVKRLDPGKIGAPLGAGVAIGLWIAVSVSTFLLGLLLLLLSPRAADATHEAARERLGASIGFGLLLFFGIPILAALALVTILRTLRLRGPAVSLPARLVAVLTATLAIVVVGLQAADNVSDADAPSSNVISPEVAVAGEWLGAHGTGGNIVVTPYLNDHIPGSAMLALGGYTGLRSYTQERIRSPRALPPSGKEPLVAAQWVMHHPFGGRTRAILERYHIEYVVFFKGYPGVPWRSFESGSGAYEKVFENGAVVIFSPREISSPVS